MDNKEIYCHFSFRRPKNTPGIGIFAVAFYYDYAGKKLAAQETRKMSLWKDHQFVTAIQSYENALYYIHKWQWLIKKNGFNKVMLVTDNSTLAGWIKNPTKNKEYSAYMNKANEMYSVGSPKEIVLSIGLCETVNYEKSYKFCKEEYVKYTVHSQDNTNVTKCAIDLDSINSKYMTIAELELENEKKKIKVDGITQI